MIIKTIVVTPFSQNARIVIDDERRVCCIVDPGGWVEHLLGIVSANEVQVESVFLTHSHLDHGGGVKALLSALPFRPPLYAHRDDTVSRSTVAMQAEYFGLPPGEFEDVPEPDTYLEDGDTFQIGSLKAEVLLTPGHAPGHLSLYFPFTDDRRILQTVEYRGQRGEVITSSHECRTPVVIAGDALFAGSIGRTDLPHANHQQLLKSIQEKLLTKPDETVVLSGHGPDTTIGRERRSNPFVGGL